jgi:hypothetical protein
MIFLCFQRYNALPLLFAGRIYFAKTSHLTHIAATYHLSPSANISFSISKQLIPRFCS